MKGENAHIQLKDDYGRSNKNQFEKQMTNIDGRRMLTKRIYNRFYGKLGSTTAEASTAVDEAYLNYASHHIIAEDQKDWEDFDQYLSHREGKDPAYDVSWPSSLQYGVRPID